MCWIIEPVEIFAVGIVSDWISQKRSISIPPHIDNAFPRLSLLEGVSVDIDARMLLIYRLGEVPIRSVVRMQ